MKKARFFKKLACTSLAACMMLSSSAFAMAVGDRTDTQTNAKWYMNEDSLIEMVGSSNDALSEHGIEEDATEYYHSLVTTETDDPDILYADYSLDLRIGNSDATINAHGVLEFCELEECSFYFGVLKTSEYLGGVRCDINITLQKETDGNKMYAGIVVAPETAESLHDFILFAVGEPFVYSPELTYESMTRQREQREISSNSANRVSTDTGNYEFIDSDYGNFTSNASGVSGRGQEVELQYDESDGRAAIGVYTYCDTIEETLEEYGGQAIVSAANMTFCLERHGTDSMYIDTPDYIPEDVASSGSEVFTSDVIDMIVSLAGDVFNASNTASGILENVLEILADNSTDVTSDHTGARSTVEFDFPTFGGGDAVFDDAPLIVTFMMDSNQRPGSGEFRAKSNMDYAAYWYDPYGENFTLFDFSTTEAATSYATLRVI